MKKDYIPATDGQAELEETAFVEAYWTRQWDGQRLSEAARSHIEGREEFKLMDPYLAVLPPGSRILDGGCGLGEWTLYYASRGFDVTGIDLSRATIERLQQRFPQRRFLTGDVRHTEFPDASFDAYFSWGTFEHFEEGVGACLEEARRILKPGGYLFVSVPFQNRRHLRRDVRALWRWDEHFNRHQGYATPMRFYQWRLTRPELQRELEMRGFRALIIKPIHKDGGVRRFLENDLHISGGSLAHRVARRLLFPVLPKAYVAHMLMVVGQKR